MNGRIFICHHQPPQRIVTTSVFSTMQSGVCDSPATGLLGDLGGRNIATPNWHSEMRHQFHVVKERLAGLDYVGFEHHRRIFFIAPLPAPQLYRFDPSLLQIGRSFASAAHQVTLMVTEPQFQSCLDVREAHDEDVKRFVDGLMRDNDIVTQRPFSLRIDEEWRSNHSPEDWDIFVDVIRRTSFYRQSYELIDFSLATIRFCNMYIMRVDLFDQYMRFWAECMEMLEVLIVPAERYFGHFAERLLNFFLNGKQMQEPSLRIGTLPYVTLPG